MAVCQLKPCSCQGQKSQLGLLMSRHLWILSHCLIILVLFMDFIIVQGLLVIRIITWLLSTMGGAVASWLVRSTTDRAVRVRDLAGDTALCSWARHLTLRVPLFPQVYKWVPANLMLGVALRWTSIPSRGEEKFLVASCYGNGDKLRPGEPHGSYADLTFIIYYTMQSWDIDLLW